MAEYTTREMIDAIEVNPPVRNFLTKWFFPVEKTHVTEKVEFDVKKGKRIMAPFVSPRVGGKVITRNGFQTKEFSTPRIAPERLTIFPKERWGRMSTAGERLPSVRMNFLQRITGNWMNPYSGGLNGCAARFFSRASWMSWMWRPAWMYKWTMASQIFSCLHPIIIGVFQP